MRSALSFSLLLACSVSFAGPYSDLQSKLANASSDSEVIRLVSQSRGPSSQADIKTTLDNEGAADPAAEAANLRAQVDLGALSEARDPNASAQAREIQQIKASPFYRDPGVDQKRNWLADALDRLRNIRFRQPDRPKGGLYANFGFLGQGLIYLVWTLLAVGVLTLLYIAAKHISWRNTLTRKAKAVMEEDEPDRTLDEWLKLADEHASAGRHREAVRALYLACLLRFDENDVASFDRSETNWEHLDRIEGSPKLPAGTDFRTATQRFDRVWYGRATEGMPDVDYFRDVYRRITESVMAAAA